MDYQDDCAGQTKAAQSGNACKSSCGCSQASMTFPDRYDTAMILAMIWHGVSIAGYCMPLRDVAAVHRPS